MKIGYRNGDIQGAIGLFANGILSTVNLKLLPD